MNIKFSIEYHKIVRQWTLYYLSKNKFHHIKQFSHLETLIHKLCWNFWFTIHIHQCMFPLKSILSHINCYPILKYIFLIIPYFFKVEYKTSNSNDNNRNCICDTDHFTGTNNSRRINNILAFYDKVQFIETIAVDYVRP